MFSIAWPRIFPDGKGKPNKKGMEFYRNLVELLVDNGIKPVATLFHWEMPQKLQDAGGWANRVTAMHFEMYEKDIAAANRHSDFLNGWFLDPIFKGKYPEGLVNWLADKVVFPEIKDGDMEIISTPVDFLGLNSYSSSSVLHDSRDWPLQTGFANTGKRRTDSGWEIYPEGLYDLLLYLHEEYNGVKIIITENGAAFRDIIDGDGKIDDDDRLHYLNDHIVQVHKAINEGVNVAGYNVWSFLDNFEWNMGYSIRFGMVYVDYKTQKRTIKKSGLWYKNVISNNSITTE